MNIACNRLIGAGELQHFESVADRREWVSEFVREGGEELILTEICVAELAVELRVLNRDRRTAGEVFGDGEIRFVVVVTGLR